MAKKVKLVSQKPAGVTSNKAQKAINRLNAQAHVSKSAFGTSFNPMSSSFAEVGRTALRGASMARKAEPTSRSTFYDVAKYGKVARKSTTLGKK